MYLDIPSQIETNCSSQNVHLYYNVGYPLGLSRVPGPHVADMLLQSDLEQSGSFRGLGDTAEK